MDYKRAILNFSFVVPGALAGMAKPGLSGPLEEDLAFLRTEGIKAILSLSETPLEESILRKSGLAYLHVPVDDFTAPTIEQVETCMEFIERMLYAENRPVVVHCGVGCGRTGTMLACHFVRKGRTAEEAIEDTKAVRPCSIETDGQRALVYHYEEYLKYRPTAE
jgi:atypical dual specificity phosphatase